MLYLPILRILIGCRRRIYPSAQLRIQTKRFDSRSCSICRKGRYLPAGVAKLCCDSGRAPPSARHKLADVWVGKRAMAFHFTRSRVGENCSLYLECPRHFPLCRVVNRCPFCLSVACPLNSQPGKAVHSSSARSITGGLRGLH